MSSPDRGPKTKFRGARRVIFALQFTVDALILLMKLYEGDRAKGRARIALVSGLLPGSLRDPLIYCTDEWDAFGDRYYLMSETIWDYTLNTSLISSHHQLERKIQDTTTEL